MDINDSGLGYQASMMYVCGCMYIYAYSVNKGWFEFKESNYERYYDKIMMDCSINMSMLTWEYHKKT